MAEVVVKVIEVIDDTGYPMFIKCELTDCKDVKHHFIDKVPVICQCDRYPSDTDTPCWKEDCTGMIRCNIVGRLDKTYIIDTEYPDDVESLNNEYRFEVWKEQVKL
jgi:hypothetical protein